MTRCLTCCRPLDESEHNWHAACSRKFFGERMPPEISLDLKELAAEGLKVVANRTAVAGVQIKLSVDIHRMEGNHGEKARLAVGVGDRFILKPPTERFPELPELESATMRLARLCRIKTAEHTLFRFVGGELGYLTRRFDRRTGGEKLPMEDFCQITERLTEDKYKGSIEQVGKAIRTYSIQPELDVAALLQLVIFCFVTGNSDMHLKNFSLLTEPVELLKKKTYRSTSGPRLSPAYDLVPSQLVMPEDKEESALTINGKRSKLKLSDFEAVAATLGISAGVVVALIKHFAQRLARVEDFLASSFVSPDTQRRYAELIRERLARLQS
jgi:serine/threonine-protein kinase HipA